MDQEPLARLTRESHWQNRILLGLLPIAILLAGVLFWGGVRVLDQERAKLEYDFRELVAYIGEQEDFLRQLQKQSAAIDEVPVTRVGKVLEMKPPEDWHVSLYEGQESVVDMPFTVACSPPRMCPTISPKMLAIGSYLADFYSTFWATSYFPAAAIFFISRGEDISVSVPAIGAFIGYEPIATDVYRSTTKAVRDILQKEPFTKGGADVSGSLTEQPLVRWFALPGSPNKMVGVAFAGFAPNLWTSEAAAPSDVFLSMLLNRNRLYAFKHPDEANPPYEFWLVNKDDGVLIGSGETPSVSRMGLSFTFDGLSWKGQDTDGQWVGISLISYSSIFSENKRLFWGAFAMLVLLLFASVWYTRWYKFNVLAPALDAQRKIMESDDFNRTLIQTAPVGLCVLSQETGALLFSNAIADQWLYIRDKDIGRTTLRDELIRISGRRQPGVFNHAGHDTERALSIAYAPSVYRAQRAMVCAFTDLTYRVQIEQELARAKQAADEASDAKSLFLSTMSHEIRTPLYGLQGTMELLATTKLDSRQRLYVSRIEEASQLLLQLISDILDMSRIEAGQLLLDSTVFSPLELVQNCVRAYAGMAQKKNLMLFSCVDPDIPSKVRGDAARIRQILSNLISNAIKFTTVGHVVIKVSQLRNASGYVNIKLEVSDTGIGIEKHHQDGLFQPFFLVEGGVNTARGAGLGLSICQRLAQLMGTSINVRSEYQIGSCFSLDLNVPVEELEAVDEPQLSGCYVVVCTPHDALTKNIYAWLRKWGAEVPVTGNQPKIKNRVSVWVDLFMSQKGVDPKWAAHYISVDPLKGESSHPEIDGYSFLSIGRGLEKIILDVPFLCKLPLTFESMQLKVLVAEDNPINQMTMRDQLEQLGCKVTIADDGEDALALWDMEPHDVVLTDVNMPHMNGYELAMTLRSEGVICPIIGITANAMLDEERRCIQAGMNICLVKPIRLNTLSQILTQFKIKIFADENEHNDNAVDNEFLLQEKFRELFLETMKKDVDKLLNALIYLDIDAVIFALHRMSGALVEVNNYTLAKKMQDLENSVKINGLKDSVQSTLTSILGELDKFMSRI